MGAPQKRKLQKTLKVTEVSKRRRLDPTTTSTSTAQVSESSGECRPLLPSGSTKEEVPLSAL